MFQKIKDKLSNIFGYLIAALSLYGLWQLISGDPLGFTSLENKDEELLGDLAELESELDQDVPDLTSEEVVDFWENI